MDELVFAYIALIVGVLSTANAQFFYKLFVLKRKYLYIGVGLLFFVIAPLARYFALKQIPLDVAYMFASLTIIFIIIKSKLFLKEAITKKRIAGISLIIIGIVIYNL